ncbi:MAG: TonB-dependent receptor [Alistipes sp.]|nr:TonB-dependent receptor [Alistipes sp.]
MKNFVKLFALSALLAAALPAAAQHIVRGRVSDGNEPLMGANVVVEGTSRGVSTGLDGSWELAVSEGETVTVSFLGYESQSVVVTAGTTQLDFTLREVQLDDVIVIGYGSVKKSDLTGAVTSVKMDAVKDLSAMSVESLLQGRAAGLQIMNTSQDPGAGAIVRIRGNSSLNGSNTPLVVVDGFPIGDAGNLSQVNPADITSIEILKDASAAAIYGSRGANGVILISTRTASGNTTRVSVNHRTTIGQFTDKLNIWRDPLLMAEIANEELTNAGLPALYTGQYNNGTYYPSLIEIRQGLWSNTDWTKLTLRTAVVNNTTATVSHSNDKTAVNLSINYFNDDGVYKKDGYRKGNISLNGSHKLGRRFTLQTSNLFSIHQRNVNNSLEYGRNPLWPVYDQDGNYWRASEQDFGHPLIISENVKNVTAGRDLISSLAAEWEIIDGLKARTQLSYNYATSIQDAYNASNTSQEAHDRNGIARINNYMSQDVLTETYITYAHKFADRHDFSIMAGHSFDYNMNRSLSTTSYGFVNDNLGNENMGAGDPERNVINNSYASSKLLSFYGRVNYQYDDRYLVTVTMRADGSSKFGSNSKWGYFPSGAVSWKMHNENWMKNQRVFDELKIRASWGVSGNQGIQPYQTLNRYGQEKYWYADKWQTAIGPGYEAGREGANDRYIIWGGIANPDLKWETTSQWNVGVDLAFLKRRLRITAEYYDKYTTDLLREKLLPLSSSYDKMWVNDGSIRNRGFEITVEGEIISRTDMSLTATLIGSHNRNRVTSLGNAVSSGLSTDRLTGMQYEYCGQSLSMFNANPSIYAVGYPMYAFYGYRVKGIIQQGEDPGFMSSDGKDLPGELKYVDLNGDYTIDDRDRCIIGDPNPDFTASLNLAFRWKNLDVSLFLNGVFGNDVIYNGYTYDPRVKTKRWTPDNPTNDYPRLNSTRSYLFSDYFVHDGSFVRLQNISVGYTVPFRNIFIRSLRIFANVENAYTFTKFDGYDPEVGVDGIYWGGYPRLRKYTVGLDLNF